MADKHFSTDVTAGGSALLAGAAYSLENFLPALWPDDWIVPWGWLFAVIAAFWIGGQFTSWVNGRHWVQDRWRKHQTKAVLCDATMRLIQETGWRALTEARILKDLHNVSIRTDTYKELGSHNSKTWKRIAKEELLRGQWCSAGHVEEIPLIQSLPRPKGVLAQGPQQNALLAAFVPTTPPTYQRDIDEGFYHVRVTITATGMRPLSRAYEFEWRDNLLRLLPLVPSATEYGNDTLRVEDGIKELWERTA